MLDFLRPRTGEGLLTLVDASRTVDEETHLLNKG